MGWEGYSQNIRSTIIQGQVQRRVLWWKPETMGYEYFLPLCPWQWGRNSKFRWYFLQVPPQHQVAFAYCNLHCRWFSSVLAESFKAALLFEA